MTDKASEKLKRARELALIAKKEKPSIKNFLIQKKIFMYHYPYSI
jgi:hypothetical protein